MLTIYKPGEFNPVTIELHCIKATRLFVVPVARQLEMYQVPNHIGGATCLWFPLTSLDQWKQLEKLSHLQQVM